MKQDSCQEKIAGRLFIYADLRLLSPLLIGQGEKNWPNIIMDN